MNDSCFVTTVDVSLKDKLMQDLENQGFAFSKPQHTLFAAKKNGVNCTLFESGKLMVQGKEMAAFLEFYLEPQILQDFSYTNRHLLIDSSPHIGVDEAGKGDFFGPLCIAGVYSSGEETVALSKMGVKDSKNLSDPTICKLAKQIKERYPYHIVRIGPKRYNEIYNQFKNLNYLLGWGHATVIEQMIAKTSCSSVTIDQFAGEHVVLQALKKKSLTVALTQRHRGEEDMVVAAASILARATFVEELKKLSDEIGMPLPLGASSLTKEAAKKIIQKFGPQFLDHLCKTHFKTYAEVLQG